MNTELIARVRELFRCDEAAGQLFWRKSNSRVKEGDRAGFLRPEGYRNVVVDGRMHREHRVIWMIIHGFVPVYIDHINGIKSDNRLCNLREANRNLNAQNLRVAKKSNKSGFLGVTKINRNVEKCWRATIKMSGKSKTLGHFYSPEDAHQAYLSAKRIIHHGCTI